jgi:hypothetical protein
MVMVTPVHSFVRRGFSIYMIDMARNRHHYCDCANTDVADAYKPGVPLEQGS